MASTPTQLETFFLQLVNQSRAGVGAKALAFDGELLDAADAHDAWMDRTDTFSHTGANGSSPGDRITAEGYGWQGYGENIAYVSGGLSEATVRQLHENLMNSPGHYANIVNGTFEEVGIGLHEGTLNGRTVTFVTEDFGRPNAAERAEPNDVGATAAPDPVQTTPVPPVPSTPAPAPAPVQTTPVPPVPSTPAPAPAPTAPAAGHAVDGNGRDNVLSGGAGDDVLNGHGGRDLLAGGGGRDTFTFDSAREANGDVVRDFVHGTDLLDFSRIDANARLPGNQGFTFIGEQGFQHAAGELRTYQAASGTVLAGDVNGDGHADFAIGLVGHHALVGADLHL